VQNFYQAASSCPHCGFTMADADSVYGEDQLTLKKVTDAAGILRMKDREVLRKELDRFERKFPQLFFSVYAAAFDDVASIRQYGFWLLNRAKFEDLEEDRLNDCGILLTIDVNAKSLGMTYGYSLLPYLTEENTFELLSHAHAHLLEGHWAEGLKIVIRKTIQHLKKKHRAVGRNPEQVLGACGQRIRQHEEAEVHVQQSAGGMSGAVLNRRVEE